MRKLWGSVLLEWRLLLRGPLVWLVCLLFGGTFYLFSQNDPYQHNIGAHAMQQNMFLMVVLLAGLLMALHVSRRDAVTKNELVLGALPVRYWQQQTAKAIALTLPLSIIALLPAILFCAAALGNDIPLHEAGAGILALASSVVPVCLIVTVGLLLGSLTSRRWIYLLGIVFFISATYGIQLLVIQRIPDHWLQLLELTQLDLFDKLLYDKQWGFLHDKLFWYHRAGYAALTVFLLLVMIAVGARRRHEQQGRKRLYVVCGLAFLTIASFTTAFMHDSLERSASIRAELQYYELSYERKVYDVAGNAIISDQVAAEAAQVSQYAQLAADRYALTVMLQDDHRLEVEATLALTNGTERDLTRFPVTLRHSYEIATLSVDGVAARYEQVPGRDYVWVYPASPLTPGQHTVQLVYAGIANDWRYEMDFSKGKYRRAAFVDEDQLLLPGTSGWFPIPGIYLLTEFDYRYTAINSIKTKETKVLKDRFFAIPPADYEVEVISARKLPMVPIVGTLAETMHTERGYETTLRAEQASGMSLVAGPLRTITARGDSLSLSLLIDRWWTSEEPEQALALLVDRSEIAARVLRELWPNGAGTSKLQPEELTIMTYSLRAELDLAPEAAYQPRLHNAGGMAYVANGDSAVVSPKLFWIDWAGYLLDEHLQGSYGNLHSFKLLFAAYVDALAEDERPEQLLPIRSGGKMVASAGNEQLYNKIYARYSEAEFRQFMIDYYALLSDPSIHFMEMYKVEEAFLQEKAGVSP